MDNSLNEYVERFTLKEENGKLIAEDTKPNAVLKEDSFWDARVRIRTKQLASGSKPLVNLEDAKNDYHVAITELSTIGVMFKGKKKMKVISSKAHFSLSQDDGHLVVEQLDGPPFSKKDIRYNKFFCTTLYARRVKQLELDVDTVLPFVENDDGSIIIEGMGDDVTPGEIADAEMRKGVFVNGEFLNEKELGCV